MDTLDQPWVLERDAHDLSPARRLSRSRGSRGCSRSPICTSTREHPQLPFGGYYALGVCQDGISGH